MNAWKNVSMIASEALMHLEDALVISRLAAKDITAEFNARPNGYKVGSTVDVTTRPEYVTKEFSGTTEKQDIRQSSRQITIEKHYDISVGVGAKEKRLNMDGFSEQVIKPAAYKIAESIDRYMASKILDGAGLYASDTLLTTRADMAQARKTAILQQLNLGGRYAIVDLDLEATLLGADYFTTYDNRGSDGSAVFREAQMGHAMGLDWFSSINFNPDSTAHTPGNGTTTTDNTGGANLVGTKTLQVDSLTGTIQAGDRIEIAGVRRPLIAAAQAVATATTVTLVDEISEIIPDGAAVTVVSSGNGPHTYRGAIFDNDSLAIAMPQLDPAEDKPSMVISSNGFSLRVVQGYDMATKESMLSIDCLVGGMAHDNRRITLLGEY
ncbi:P22 phage major capsid protein family protein [Zhongshania sp.]|uniref:P22 phage major capsid protein family protein n=1 Tax=Zhongshania sp. TaxID=1971902 RepID=UPI003563CB2D